MVVVVRGNQTHELIHKRWSAAAQPGHRVKVTLGHFESQSNGAKDNRGRILGIKMNVVGSAFRALE